MFFRRSVYKALFLLFFLIIIFKQISGSEFFAYVKKTVGAEVPDDQFVVPREAYDALAAEYDSVCGEAAEFKVSLT